jgi:hypothetical protein
MFEIFTNICPYSLFSNTNHAGAHSFFCVKCLLFLCIQPKSEYIRKVKIKKLEIHTCLVRVTLFHADKHKEDSSQYAGIGRARGLRRWGTKVEVRAHCGRSWTAVKVLFFHFWQLLLSWWRGNMLLWNAGKVLPDYMASHPRRGLSS